MPAARNVAEWPMGMQVQKVTLYTQIDLACDRERGKSDISF